MLKSMQFITFLKQLFHLVSCQERTKEDIPPGETEMTSMMSGKTKAYLM